MKYNQTERTNTQQFLICLGIWAGFALFFFITSSVWGHTGFDDFALHLLLVSIISLIPCIFKAFYCSAIFSSLYLFLTAIGDMAAYNTYNSELDIGGTDVVVVFAFHGLVLGLIIGILTENVIRLKKKTA